MFVSKTVQTEIDLVFGDIGKKKKGSPPLFFKKK